MTELLIAAPAHRRFAGAGEESAISDGGRLTLGQLMDSVWEGLHAAGAAGCPACAGRMERAAGAGHCRGCGAVLA
jgi:hypothetical protein